jgi:hypothetical protein
MCYRAERDFVSVPELLFVRSIAFSPGMTRNLIVRFLRANHFAVLCANQWGDAHAQKKQKGEPVHKGGSFSALSTPRGFVSFL